MTTPKHWRATKRLGAALAVSALGMAIGMPAARASTPGSGGHGDGGGRALEYERHLAFANGFFTDCTSPPTPNADCLGYRVDGRKLDEHAGERELQNALVWVSVFAIHVSPEGAPMPTFIASSAPDGTPGKVRIQGAAQARVRGSVSVAMPTGTTLRLGIDMLITGGTVVPNSVDLPSTAAITCPSGLAALHVRSVETFDGSTGGSMTADGQALTPVPPFAGFPAHLYSEVATGTCNP